MHVPSRQVSQPSFPAKELLGLILFLGPVVHAYGVDDFDREVWDVGGWITSPLDLLARYGLRNRKGVWICREESRWLRVAGDLKVLEREFLLTRRAAQDYIARSIRHRSHLAAIQEKYDENRRLQLEGRVSVLASERFNEQQRQLSLRIADAREQWRISFDGLREDSEITRHVRAYAIARLRLEASLISLDLLLPKITETYQTLERVAAVRNSLQTLAKAQQPAALGPGDEFVSQREHGERLRGELLASPVAAYREGLRFRVGAILNDSTTISLRVVEKEGFPIVLSHQLALAAGLEPLPSGASRSVSVEGRLFRTIPYRITTLRIGKTTLSDLEAWVVAEGEDDPGPHMGFDAVSGHQLHVDPRQLAVSISSP